jgi:hypothetical protein
MAAALSASLTQMQYQAPPYSKKLGINLPIIFMMEELLSYH